MKVKFTQTRTTKEKNPVTFREGEVHDLNTASAQHWINRGVAVEVEVHGKKVSEPTPQSRGQDTLVVEAPEPKENPDRRSPPDAFKSTDIKKK